jgi:hypothetical protein
MNIKTLKDLRRALDKNPDLVEAAKEEVSVIDDLEEYLAWLDRAEATTIVTTELRRKKKRSSGIHPSAACKKKGCLLKLYYDCTGEVEPGPVYRPEMQRMWDLGTSQHDIYQAHFNNMFGNQFQDEVPLKDPDLHIKSHADGLFDFTKVRAVLEMKTIKTGGNFGWAKVQHRPLPDNVRQTHFYMKLADTPFAVIFYYSKNTSEIKEHVVVFDFYLWDELLTEVVEPVIEAAYNGGPKVKATVGFLCDYCDYKYACPAHTKDKTHVRGFRRFSKR